MSQSTNGIATHTHAIISYRIQVSQRYLDLTRQKLGLARLPRERRLLYGNLSLDSGISKSELERLIDHWIEKYDWKAEESIINDTLQQFRTTVLGQRLHFVWRRSTTPQAIPLLFVHGWPESFLTVAPVIDALCEPTVSPSTGQQDGPSFHVVAPTIPGFGFSDEVADEGNNFWSTAEIFDALMKRLGYSRYIIHGSGWWDTISPGRQNRMLMNVRGFKIARAISLRHPESCMAVHTVNPGMPLPMFVNMSVRRLDYYCADEHPGFSSETAYTRCQWRVRARSHLVLLVHSIPEHQ
jgi:hypothetical protein